MNESNPIGESDRLLVDSFTFIHNDIQLSTNSVRCFDGFYLNIFVFFSHNIVRLWILLIIYFYMLNRKKK